MIRRKTNRRHMTSDHHGRTASRATLQVTATDEILGTHGARGGILSESTYGRIWHAAREIALGPQLAATSLARRPYDLRHAALSLWLNATGAPAEVAARAGNSVHVLQDVYAHCTDGREDLIGQQIEDALDPHSGIPHVPQCVTASGYTHRWHRPEAVRHMSVNDPERPRRGPQLSGRALLFVADLLSPTRKTIYHAHVQCRTALPSYRQGGDRASPAIPGIGPTGCSRRQLMWRWRSSVFDGPGSVGAIQGPGIDGSMMPSSSHE